MDNKAKEGSMMPIFIVLLISLAIAFFWDTFPMIKDNVGKVLDPTAGALLNWHVTYGFLILIFILTIIMTLGQKYLTDQDTMREMKAEQKKLTQDLKQLGPTSPEYREMSMKSFQFMGPMMKLSMRPIMFTGVPMILFFRWFMDTFAALGSPKFWIFSWFWFYLIMSMIFSSILRKILKVA